MQKQSIQNAQEDKIRRKKIIRKQKDGRKYKIEENKTKIWQTKKTKNVRNQKKAR